MINQNWVFGRHAGLDFGTGNPMPTPTSGFAMNTFEGCASVSDQNGNLIFYTDGQAVWDSNHQQVHSGLRGDPSSTQSSIIVPDPANSDQYFIFTTDGTSNPNPPFHHFDGVLIEPQNNWAVSPVFDGTNDPPTQLFSPTERLTAIQRPNCRDFWIVTIVQETRSPSEVGLNFGPGHIRIFSLDNNGLSHVRDVDMQRITRDMGCLRIDPSGTQLAVANNDGEVLVYPFDNQLGEVDILGVRVFNIPNSNSTTQTPYGVEFSENGRYLYYTLLSVGTGPIFQIDLSTTSFASTEIGTIPSNGNRYAIGALQRFIQASKTFLCCHGNIVVSLSPWCTAACSSVP